MVAKKTTSKTSIDVSDAQVSISLDEPEKKRTVKQIDMKSHIKKKSMWAGSKNSQSLDTYVLVEQPKDKTADDEDSTQSKIFTIETLKYPPALFKIIDEIITNALDHYVEYPKKVNQIRINVTPDGSISVYNNGPGIAIEETKNLQGVVMYTPQLIFSEFLAGSNLDDNNDRIVGGTNGLGAKITAIFSKYFTVETYSNGVYYKQTFTDGLDVINAPIIINTNSKDPEDKQDIKNLTPSMKTEHTEITFLPDFAEFKLNIKTFYPILVKLIETRAWQAAAYSGINVSFNGELIPVKTFKDFCSMFSEFDIISTKMTNSKTHKYPWDICIGLTTGSPQQLSMINGVFIPAGGTHIKYIQNILVDNLQPRIEKELKKAKVKFNKNLLLNNLFIFMKGSISSPEFLSQTKDAISTPIESYNGYEFPTAIWPKIWSLVEPAVMATFLKKQLGDVRLRANRGKIDVPKYKEANYCRNAKKCHECGLIIAEGDSAIGTADKGLLANASPNFNYDYFGTYSIQGVMLNSLKESIELGKKKMTPNVRRIPNKKVLANERISSLIKVLGLDFNKSYDYSDNGEKEWATLRYGYIAGLTDQDLDGFNIFGLLCTFFMTYWPALVKRGFIRRINTPLIRAYPKNKAGGKFTKEFYTEKEAKAWVQEVGEEFANKNYDFKYYKGLASHVELKVKKEVTQMFRHIDDKLCTYILDEDAIKSMHIYYGDDTAPRKVALSTPVTVEPVDGLEIPLSQHFNVDTKLFQRDNIIRKLLNAIDGFVSSRRKVFYTARKIGHKEIKVAGLASEVVTRANYHHGEDSLEETIIRMAQAYPGARNLPLLLPLGNFGSRGKGYKDSGASRYIYTTVNHRLADKLFRKEDEFLLEYEVEDGERFEPKYYVPVIPYILCETNELPATGWAISTHARDLSAILKNVKDMISGKIKKCGKLPIWKKDFKGDIRNYKNPKTKKERTYFVGCYIYDEKENMVTITDLPPGNYSHTYLHGPDESIKKKAARTIKKGILSKEHIEDYDDNTTQEQINIKLYLKPDAYGIISEKYGNETFDCFEEYLELKEPIYHHINLVNEKGEVIEYKSYEDVFDDWFKFRKDLYGIRIEREVILNDLEIEMLLNMQRFSQHHDTYNITKKTTIEEASEIIKIHKYKLFNKTLLDNPKYTEVKELIKLITDEKHGASYDYLIDMGYRDLTKEAYAKREKKIEALRDRQKYLQDDSGAFKGATIWAHEVDELCASIEKGLETEWCYDAKDCLFEEPDTESDNKRGGTGNAKRGGRRGGTKSTRGKRVQNS